MKKILFLTITLISLLLPIFVVAQISIIPAHNLDNSICPGLYNYTLTGVPSGCTYNMEAFDQNNNKIGTYNEGVLTVIWPDRPGKVRVQTNVSTGTSCTIPKNLDIVVHSVKTLKPRIENCQNVIIGTEVTITLTARLSYQISVNQGNSDPEFECNEYEWRLKSGTAPNWTLQPFSNPGILNKQCIVTTDIANNGTIEVRGKDECGNWSDWAECEIKRFVQRPCPISGAPKSVLCEDQTPINIEGKLIPNVVGHTYGWTFPSGWIGNTNSINTIVTPNGINGGNITLTAYAYGLSSEPCTTTIKLEVISPSTSITGSAFLCPSKPEDYTLTELNKLPPSSQVSWEVTPQNAVKVAAGTGIPITLIADNAYNGNATISLIIKNQCGTATIQKQIFVGAPLKPEVVVPDCFKIGSSIYLTMTTSGATSYSWTLPSCSQQYNDPNNDPFPYDCWVNYKPNSTNVPTPKFYVGNSGNYISVFAANACGVASSLIKVNYCEGGGNTPTGPFFPLIWNGGNYGNIYPNPVQADLMIELDVEDFVPESPKNIYVTDMTGGQRQSFGSFEGNTRAVDLSELGAGSYIICIEANERTVYSRFIKE